MSTTHIRGFLLTEEGHQALKNELEHLVTVSRKEIADRIRTAKEFGDIADNPEYDDAKNEQAYIEGRIEELHSYLDNAYTVDSNSIPTDTVGFGSLVTVYDADNDDEWTFRLVSAPEAGDDDDLLSIDSPLGKALVGHAVGDTLEVKAPAGTVRIKILDISK